ncbi:hypothetical protein MesoLj113c_41710 [Mesorhizobium sp. 113-3-9]|nr:hypothetical protein MesoLj113c_41710 [Mesorhizobium sp. 113-3-9]
MALRVDLDKRAALTGLAGRLKIDLFHILGRLRDRAIEKVTSPPKLRQEECGDTLEVFGCERPNRAVLRLQHRRRSHAFHTGIYRTKMHREAYGGRLPEGETLR